MPRVAVRIELTEPERTELEGRARARRGPYRDRRRAQVILLASEGRENREIAEHIKLSRLAVGKWRERFSRERLAGLADAPGPRALEHLSTRKGPSGVKSGGATTRAPEPLELPHDGSGGGGQ
jgi:hypothetical protein